MAEREVNPQQQNKTVAYDGTSIGRAFSSAFSSAFGPNSYGPFSSAFSSAFKRSVGEIDMSVTDYARQHVTGSTSKQFSSAFSSAFDTVGAGEYNIVVSDNYDDDRTVEEQ